MAGLTLLVGGARSGKSALATVWGRRHAEGGGDVRFIATATPLDADMERRIERHRAERPPWPTVEEPHDLIGATADDDGALVIVDCLTLWVSNLMLRGDDDEAIVAAALATTRHLAGRRGSSVVITNEVGMGVHPANDLGRRYRDVLGSVNQTFSSAAAQVLLLVAGRVLRLDDPTRFEP